jgi:hypothetical protein
MFFLFFVVVFFVSMLVLFSRFPAILFHGVFRRLRWFWRFVLVSEALALC